jgi:hypothetical protein
MKSWRNALENMTKVNETSEIPAEDMASIKRQGAILQLPYFERPLLQAKDQTERWR